MSSVKSELTANTLANQVVLERRQAVRAVLLVEGGTDARYFRRFVDRSECSITVCHDREKLILTLSLLRTRGIDGVLGVADRDYDDFVDEDPISDPNIVFWDNNDLESTILPVTLRKILNEYGSATKIGELERSSRKNPIELLIEEAAKIGALRALNRRKLIGLRFKGMTFQFVRGAGFEVDLTSTIEHVCNRSGLPQLVDEISQEYNAIRLSAPNTICLCHGHDFMRIVGRALRTSLGTISDFDKNDGQSNPLYSIVRISHETSDFIETKICKSIIAWQVRNLPWRVLPF